LQTSVVEAEHGYVLVCRHIHVYGVSAHQLFVSVLLVVTLLCV